MIRRTALTLALALAATAASTVAVRADDSVTLAIGQKGNWDTAVTQLGIDQGFFKKEHLTLNLSYTAGGSDTIQAVSTGSADFGLAVGTTAAIAAFAKGAPVRIVSSEMKGAGDLFYYVKADSPIKSIADTNGKSWGFSRPGSSSFTVAHVLAADAHVTPNFVSSGEIPATQTQVMSGQLDVGWSAVPYGLDQAQQKKIRVIARGSDAKELNGQTVRVNIANANFLKNRHDVAVRYMRAYAETVDWMYKNPAAAQAAYAKAFGTTPEQGKEIQAFFTRTALLPTAPGEFDKSVQDAVAVKFIPKPLDAEQDKAIMDIVYEAH
jgi:NitT/TauT family transport system substrate-binding protein